MKQTDDRDALRERDWKSVWARTPDCVTDGMHAAFDRIHARELRRRQARRIALCAACAVLALGMAAYGVRARMNDRLDHVAQPKIEALVLTQDSEVFAANADPCFHIRADCPKAGGGCVALKLISALEDVRAAARGGTIVVRFSDEWVYNHELTGVFGFMPADVSEGEAGWMQLGKYLHGARYADFLADYAADGKAEGRCCVPWVLGTGEPDGEDWKDLKMSARHIGASWYIVIRPESKFEKTWRMFWRVSSYELTLTDDGLTSLFDLQTLEENRLMQLERFKGASPEYQRDGDLQISVFDALGGHIAVLSQQNGEALADARLIIDGRDTGARLSGYADGANAVYCCALTEGELAQLRDGAAAAIVA